MNSIALLAESRTLVSLLLALYVNFRVCPVGSVALVRSSPVYYVKRENLFKFSMISQDSIEINVKCVFSMKVKSIALTNLIIFSSLPISLISYSLREHIIESKYT